MSDQSGVIGRVVWSRAGRDKKRPFLIVGIADDGKVLIADGKLRTLAKPKKKNLKHLVITDAMTDVSLFDDAAVAGYLRSYENQAR